MPVLQVLNHLLLPATTWLVLYVWPKYGVSDARHVGCDLFDKDKQRVAFLVVLHASESSNFYRIQEDL
jgi:hypothetical protein